MVASFSGTAVLQATESWVGPVLQAMESWAGPGNEAREMVLQKHCNTHSRIIFGFYARLSHVKLMMPRATPM